MHDYSVTFIRNCATFLLNCTFKRVFPFHVTQLWYIIINCPKWLFLCKFYFAFSLPWYVFDFSKKISKQCICLAHKTSTTAIKMNKLINKTNVLGKSRMVTKYILNILSSAFIDKIAKSLLEKMVQLIWNALRSKYFQ